MAKMTIQEAKSKLDELDIDYSGAKKLDDYIELLNKAEGEEPNIAEKFKKAVDKNISGSAEASIASTPKTIPSEYAHLLGRSDLSFAEREIVATFSAVYPEIKGGVAVSVTDRLLSNSKTVELDGEPFVFKKGVTYNVTKAHADILTAMTGTLKSEETKNLCCGNVKKVEGNFFVEVVNG